MLTANYQGPRQIGIREAEPEPPRPDEVRIEVAYTGICGTDLHIYHGHMDGRVDPPAIIGHEMSGVIAALGEAVTDWQVGDHVTVMPLDWDNTCPACVAGHQHICQNLNFIGIDSPGALQRYWNVNANTLVGLPKELRLDHAALIEPIAVAVHDVRRAELSTGDKAVVIGGGPIGVLIAAVAKQTGADVVLIELDPQRRQAAADMGFEVLDPTAQTEWVENWTGGAGADVVFEVSGAAAAVLAATDLLKVRGTLVVVAIHPEPRPVNLHRVFWRELRLLGARVYQRTDFEQAVKLLTQGAIPAEQLITHIKPITATAEAFEALESGQAMKVLINLAAEETPA